VGVEYGLKIIQVYELSEESTQIGDECPICFDEFEQGKPTNS
jgi:hypothetical protein